MALSTVKLVPMVALEVFTPYKAGEPFCVTEEEAEKLLKADNTRNAYGVPRYPKIKCRLLDLDDDRDLELLLNSGTLNVADYNRLQRRLHPTRPEKTLSSTVYESGITDLLNDIDPGRVQKAKLPDLPDGAKQTAEEVDQQRADEEEAVVKAAQGGGLRARRRQAE